MADGGGILGYRFSTVSADLSWRAFLGRQDFSSFKSSEFVEDALAACRSLKEAAALVGQGDGLEGGNRSSEIPNHVRSFLMTNSRTAEDAFVGVDDAVDAIMSDLSKDDLSIEVLFKIEGVLNDISLKLQSFEI